MSGSAAPGAGFFSVETTSDWAAAVPGWEEGQTPFQHPTWLAAWYGALEGRAGLAPLLVTVRVRETGALALRLPLVVDATGPRRIIAFADLGLTDYNAPLLGPASPRDAAGARALWRAVRGALPRADLLDLRKMPAVLQGRPNPLALLPGVRPCPLNGNLVTTGEDWDAYRHGLVRTVRKELERSWRVFSREPGTSFRIVADPDEGLRVVAVMARQQEARMRAIGADYRLDEAAFDAFYRRLAAEGIGSGYVLVTALMAGDEVVASLLGIRDAGSYVMVRIGNAGTRWSHCSPGRLVIERTMAALHAEGCRAFDFSVGDYDYKRRFGVAPLPLVDLTLALGWRGLPAAARAALAGGLRRHPDLDRRVRAVIDRLATMRRTRG